MAISMLAAMVADLDEQNTDALTVAEVSIDEVLTIMNEHGVNPCDAAYVAFKEMSGWLNDLLTVKDGAAKRYSRLSRVRDVLTETFKASVLEASPAEEK